MPSWAQFVQGVTTILNSSGTALARRKTLQFGTGLKATDDGEKTVVTFSGEGASTSDDVSNESTVSGTTVTDALDTLLAGGGGSSSVTDSSLAQDPASGSVVLTLLASSHTAGLYQVGCYAKVTTAPTTGTTTPTLAYSDSGAQSLEMFPAPQNLVPAGTLNFFTTTIQSDGVSAVTITFDFASVTGSGSVDFYAWGLA